MSVIRAFCGSYGSSSPNARPVSVSYWPASPNEGHTGGVPVQNAGDVLVSITIFVTLASDVAVHTRSAAAAHANRVSRWILISFPSLFSGVAQRRLGLGRLIAVRGRDAGLQSGIQEPRLLVVGVLAQHQAILDESVDRAHHLASIVRERRIALLDRRARIARGQALGLGSGEWNVLARALAAVVGLR